MAEAAPPALAANSVPEEARQFGFAIRPSGALASRTLMLAELRELLAVCPAGEDFAGYRRAIVERQRPDHHAAAE